MISTSQDWKDYSEEFDIYHIRATLTDANGNSLSLTDEDFMMGTVRVTDSTSSESSFDLGSVITNTFVGTLNNISGKFNVFNFNGSTIAVEFGIIYEDSSEEWIERGIYTVDRPTSYGYTLEITAYDFMDRMNRAYIGKDKDWVDITFPIQSSALAEILCDYCGVPFDSWNIANDLSVDEFEYNESTSCREVLGWLCQINCGFARMTPQGELKVQWYSSGSIVNGDALDGGIMSPWGSDENADGGIMQPWEVGVVIDGGYAVDYILTSISQVTINSEDIRITGVRAYVPDTVDDFDFATVGSMGYMLSIENNQLINTDNKVIVANAIWSKLKGMKLRPFTASIYGDPSIEAGDLIGVHDYLGNLFITYITSFTYTLNGLVEIECSAESPTANSNTYSSESTSIMQGAAGVAYDYIRAKKISADYIDAGTIEASVVARDLKIEGGSINITTNDEYADWIELNLNSGTGRYVGDMSPTHVGITMDTDYYADFIGNRFVNAGLEVGRWEGQTQVPVLTADALGNVFIDGTGTAKFSGSVTASAFVNSSKEELKKDIEKADSTLSKIINADIVKFNYIEEDGTKKHIGLAIGEKYNTPSEIIAVDDKGEESGVDLYAMVSMAWKAIQEQQEIIEDLQKRLDPKTKE